MTEVNTSSGNGTASELVTSEKAAWFRIVSDLESELSAVRSQLDAKDETIAELRGKYETEKALRGRFEEKADKLSAELKLAKEGTDRSSSAASSSAQSTVPPGLPASRSHEIEAWMEICSVLRLSKPTFTGTGALHQSTLRNATEGVKNVAARDTQRGAELDAARRKLDAQQKEIADLRKKASDAESLPSGFRDDDDGEGGGGGRRVGFAGGSSSGSGGAAGRQFRTAKSAAELAVVRWADTMVDSALQSLSDKFDTIYKSIVMNMGEPRWRGPKGPDGAKWVGTWDSVVGGNASSPSSSHGGGGGGGNSPPRSMAEQNEQILHMMQQLLENQSHQQQGGGGGVPPAMEHGRREMLQQQIQQQLASQAQRHQQQQQPMYQSAGNSAGPEVGTRGSSPTSWRRVLDSHPQQHPLQQQQQQQAAAMHPSNYYLQHQQPRNAILVGSGGSGRQGAASRLLSPGRGGGAQGQYHQHYYNQQQHARNSPPRSTSPLGNSATIRQILEKMQMERNSFARSRSGSPAQHQQHGAGGDGGAGFPLVRQAVRRSQSPPTRDGDHHHQGEHVHFHPQGRQVSGTRFVASPFNMADLNNNRARSALPSQRYSSGRRW